jgi:hypothetical protein
MVSSDHPRHLRSCHVEAIQIHHLVPGRHEITHEPILGVRAPIPSDIARSTECEPKARSARVLVHLTASVLRSRPSYRPLSEDGCHSVPMSSRFTKRAYGSQSERTHDPELGSGAYRLPAIAAFAVQSVGVDAAAVARGSGVAAGREREVPVMWLAQSGARRGTPE